jgi:hypothetical protein
LLKQSSVHMHKGSQSSTGWCSGLTAAETGPFTAWECLQDAPVLNYREKQIPQKLFPHWQEFVMGGGQWTAQLFKKFPVGMQREGSQP